MAYIQQASTDRVCITNKDIYDRLSENLTFANLHFDKKKFSALFVMSKEWITKISAYCGE